MKSRSKALLGLGAASALGAYAARRWAARRRWDGFRGRVVAITGGSRGLGLSLAREFARRGARLAICGRDPDTLAQAKRDLEARGADVFVMACDVGDAQSAADFIRETQQRYGLIDVLINNAGVMEVGPVEAMSWENFDLAMRVHYWAPLNTCLAALPMMKARACGRIVNIASIGGEVSVPHLLPYDSSKAALVRLSEGLGAELSKYGIQVLTVCPGLMRTGSPRHARFKGGSRAEYAWFKLLDLMPIVTISAERAARQIVEACRRGDAELYLTWPAKLAARIHGLMPATTTRLLSLVDRLLPRTAHGPVPSLKGSESESALTRHFGRETERAHGQR